MKFIVWTKLKKYEKTILYKFIRIIFCIGIGIAIIVPIITAAAVAKDADLLVGLAIIIGVILSIIIGTIVGRKTHFFLGGGSIITGILITVLFISIMLGIPLFQK